MSRALNPSFLQVYKIWQDTKIPKLDQNYCLLWKDQRKWILLRYMSRPLKSPFRISTRIQSQLKFASTQLFRNMPVTLTIIKQPNLLIIVISSSPRLLTHDKWHWMSNLSISWLEIFLWIYNSNCQTLNKLRICFGQHPRLMFTEGLRPVRLC